jgi:hypothetical protein
LVVISPLINQEITIYYKDVSPYTVFKQGLVMGVKKIVMDSPFPSQT